MRLVRVPGVYGPCRDSELLAHAVRSEVRPADRVLDVFTGSGFQAITAAQAGAARVTAVDVARRAVLGTRLNARLNGVRVEALRGSLFEPLGARTFDLIVANPPYVPTVDDGPVRGAARAWEGGGDGRHLLDLLIDGLPSHLAPGGRVLIVHSSLCDEARTVAALADAGINAETVAEETAPLGPITAPRAEELERRGLLQPGERTERTVVIRGVARTAATPPRADAGAGDTPALVGA
jgi:release factor glutamine methyltransferase